MEKDVTRQASLISQRHHELVTQIVLHIRRVGKNTHGGGGAGEVLDANRTGGRHSIRAKRRTRIRIRRLARMDCLPPVRLASKSSPAPSPPCVFITTRRICNTIW